MKKTGTKHKFDIQELAGGLKGKAGGLLTLLHSITERIGYIPKDSIPEIAKGLNMSEAEVFGAISFYHDFSFEPPATHSIRLCRGESCHSKGGRELAVYLTTELGIGFGEATKDGRVSLGGVYCFGNCACSPSVMIDGKLYGRLDIDGLKKLVAALKDKR